MPSSLCICMIRRSRASSSAGGKNKKRPGPHSLTKPSTSNKQDRPWEDCQCPKSQRHPAPAKPSRDFDIIMVYHYSLFFGIMIHLQRSPDHPRFHLHLVRRDFGFWLSLAHGDEDRDHVVFEGRLLGRVHHGLRQRGLALGLGVDDEGQGVSQCKETCNSNSAKKRSRDTPSLWESVCLYLSFSKPLWDFIARTPAALKISGAKIKTQKRSQIKVPSRVSPMRPMTFQRNSSLVECACPSQKRWKTICLMFFNFVADFQKHHLPTLISSKCNTSKSKAAAKWPRTTNELLEAFPQKQMATLQSDAGNWGQVVGEGRQVDQLVELWLKLPPWPRRKKIFNRMRWGKEI